MKKLTALILAALLLALALPALADANLDAAFEAGTVTLTPVELPAVTAQDFEFTDELLAMQDGVSAGELRAQLETAISESKFVPLSLSPKGNSAILCVDRKKLITMYQGKYHIAYPSQSRGVADEYGNLDQYTQIAAMRLFGDEGVTYSPDGRYAAVVNVSLALQNMQFFFDPIVIDLSTGEIFLTATYGNSLAKAGAGAVTAAHFSADGRYLYYLLYGTTTEYRAALYRYDLETDATELCYSGYDCTYNPALCETANGGWMMIRNAIRQNEVGGIVCLDENDGQWTAQERDFALGMLYWDGYRMIYSANSDNALVTGRGAVLNGASFIFQCFQPDAGFAGLNRYLAVSREDGQIVSLAAEEMQASVDPFLAGNATSDLPYRMIVCARLSPDGNYALLLTRGHAWEEQPSRLILVRLSDLAAQEIAGVNAADILYMGNMAMQIFPQIIEWNTDTLLIGMQDGSVRAYRFE